MVTYLGLVHPLEVNADTEYLPFWRRTAKYPAWSVRLAHDCAPRTTTMVPRPTPLEASVTRPLSQPVSGPLAGEPVARCGRVMAVSNTPARNRPTTTGSTSERRWRVRSTWPPFSRKSCALAGFPARAHEVRRFGPAGNPAGLAGLPTLHRLGPVALRPRIAPGLPLSEASLPLTHS